MRSQVGPLDASSKTSSVNISAIAKRGIDIAGATAGLVLLSPVLIAGALAVWAGLGRPILYGQFRPGLNERPFRVWKFRTMTDARDGDGRLLPDGDRLTLVGRRLRQLSIDELPQLFNVLAGQMSLVGPRPLLSRYLDRYNARQRRRHLVKPGITGWAQVNGRNVASWEQRLEHDVWYAENASLSLDLRILMLTCRQLLHIGSVRAGAGSEFDEFWGTEAIPQSGPRAFPVEADERTWK